MNIEVKAVTNGLAMESSDNLTPDEIPAYAARGDYMEESLIGVSPEEAINGYNLEASDLVFLKEVGEEWEYDEDHVERRWNNYGVKKFPDRFIYQAKLRAMIADLLRRGHFGPFEHVNFYFAVEDISRVAMAQVTRHRHKSWDVQSQRYANFGGKDPVVPPSMEEPESDLTIYETWADTLETHWEMSVARYSEAIEAGIPKEDARFFLPQATPVNMTFSGNMRSLMHLFDIRDNQKAQWEAQDFASMVADLMEEYAPITAEMYDRFVNNNSLRAP